MGRDRFDRIYIRDLQLRCVIGLYPEERREKQDVIVNVMLETDLSKPCQTDNIDDTVDYKTIKKEIVTMVEQSACLLVERLAQQVADICLENKAVKRATITVDKPEALRFARSVAVEIVRER